MANTFVNKSAQMGTAATTFYTSPASTVSIVHSLYLSNTDASNSVRATIQLYDNSAASTLSIVSNAIIGPGSSLILDKPVNLEESDALKISASEANKLEAVGSILQQT